MKIDYLNERNDILLNNDEDILDFVIFLESQFQDNTEIFVDGCRTILFKSELASLLNLKKGLYIVNLFTIYHNNYNGMDDTVVISLNLVE